VEENDRSWTWRRKGTSVVETLKSDRSVQLAKDKRQSGCSKISQSLTQTRDPYDPLPGTNVLIYELE